MDSDRSRKEEFIMRNDSHIGELVNFIDDPDQGPPISSMPEGWMTTPKDQARLIRVFENVIKWSNELVAKDFEGTKKESAT